MPKCSLFDKIIITVLKKVGVYMALFADSNTLYQNIKAALPDWSFAENPSISDAVLGTIPSGKFSLWTTPSREELVVS